MAGRHQWKNAVEFLAVIHLLFNKTCSHAFYVGLQNLIFAACFSIAIIIYVFLFLNFFFLSLSHCIGSRFLLLFLALSLLAKRVRISWAEHNGEYSAASKPPNQHPPGAYSDAITITISTRSSCVCFCIFYALVLLVNCKTLFFVGKIFHLNR